MTRLEITIIACTVGLVIALNIIVIPINLKLDAITKAVITSAVIADPQFTP